MNVPQVSGSELEALAGEARERWGSSTPYRKGVIAGERGMIVANPYPIGSMGARNFEQGINDGYALRARARSQASTSVIGGGA